MLKKKHPKLEKTTMHHLQADFAYVHTEKFDHMIPLFAYCSSPSCPVDITRP